MDNKLLGKKIKFLRSKKSSELGYKYTGQMLADKLSISRSYLGDIESGRIHPNPGLLSRLASALDVDVNFFIEENDQWYFDGYDLIVDFDEKLQEPKYVYKKI